MSAYTMTKLGNVKTSTPSWLQLTNRKSINSLFFHFFIELYRHSFFLCLLSCLVNSLVIKMSFQRMFFLKFYLLLYLFLYGFFGIRLEQKNNVDLINKHREVNRFREGLRKKLTDRALVDLSSQPSSKSTNSQSRLFDLQNPKISK